MRETTKQPVPQLTDAPPERAVELVEPDNGMFRTYSNHHLLGWTGYDVRMLFGELVEITDDKYVIEQTAQITLSWQQAKLLLGNLQDVISRYEAINGPIEPVKVPS